MLEAYRYKGKMLLIVVTLLMITLGIEQHTTVHGSKETVNLSSTSNLDSYVQQRINDLSAHPTYSHWKAADTRISSLGPGTHAWLVVLTSNQETLGYLIINAVEEGGFQLGEYGIGEYPPYQYHALRNALRQLALHNQSYRVERHYQHPLQAYWGITIGQSVHFIDAYTGELLPITALQVPTTIPSIATSTVQIEEHHMNPTFHPYIRMPWLTKAPLDLLPEQEYMETLKTLIKNNTKLQYTTHEQNIRNVWSVVGFDSTTEGELFVALDNDEDTATLRYVSSHLLIAYGKFYR